MNILMIVSDTFRKDNLSCYAVRRVRTPHLDRFAERCVVFSRAYAASFPTMPARARMRRSGGYMSSQYRSHISVTNVSASIMPSTLRRPLVVAR